MKDYRWFASVLASVLVVTLALPVEARQFSGGARTSVNHGGNHGGNMNREAGANRGANLNRTANANRNANINRNANMNHQTNINRNINVDRDVNVNVNNGGWYNDNYHPIATAAAVTATAVVTAAVVGSIVHSIPPSCTVVSVNGMTYQQCGSTWYQPQYVGTQVQYVVVNAPG